LVYKRNQTTIAIVQKKGKKIKRIENVRRAATFALALSERPTGGCLV